MFYVEVFLSVVAFVVVVVVVVVVWNCSEGDSSSVWYGLITPLRKSSVGYVSATSFRSWIVKIKFVLFDLRASSFFFWISFFMREFKNNSADVCKMGIPSAEVLPVFSLSNNLLMRAYDTRFFFLLFELCNITLSSSSTYFA